nr:unnamed protein product [Spirometra erinaceieuropaei]
MPSRRCWSKDLDELDLNLSLPVPEVEAGHWHSNAALVRPPAASFARVGVLPFPLPQGGFGVGNVRVLTLVLDFSPAGASKQRTCASSSAATPLPATSAAAAGPFWFRCSLHSARDRSDLLIGCGGGESDAVGVVPPDDHFASAAGVGGRPFI